MQNIKFPISTFPRRLLLCVSIFVLASTTCIAQTADKTAIIRQCESEAIVSLRIAAAYFDLHGRSKEKTLDFAKTAGENGTGIANNLFDLAESKAVSSTPEFATERIFSCFQKQNFPLDGETTRQNSTVCFARSEAIYYSYAFKNSLKLSKEASLANLENMQKNREIWPSEFLKNVNDLTFSRSDNLLESAENQKRFYWSCLGAVRNSK